MALDFHTPYTPAPTLIPVQGPRRDPSRRLRIAVSVLATVGLAGVVASGATFALYRGEQDRLHVAHAQAQQLRRDLLDVQGSLSIARSATDEANRKLIAARDQVKAADSNRSDLLVCLTSWLRVSQLQSAGDLETAATVAGDNHALCSSAIAGTSVAADSAA